MATPGTASAVTPARATIFLMGRFTAPSSWGIASRAIPQPAVAAVAGDDEQDERAEDDLLVGLVVALADEHRRQRGEDERAGDGVGVVAARAHERGPADDHGREAAEEVGVADRLVGAGEAGEEDADERGQDRAGHEH